MKTQKLILTSALLFFAIYANATVQTTNEEPIYSSKYTLGGFYQNYEDSFAELDILFPFQQNPDHILFADLRGRIQQDTVHEENFALGYRHLSGDYLFGLYTFYDRLDSFWGNSYNQLTVGAEFKTAVLSLVSNAYIPFGKTEYTYTPFANIPVNYNFDPFGFRYLKEITFSEFAMPGADLELGYRPSILPELTVYVGGYCFAHSGVSPLTGPRARITYDLAPILKMSSSSFIRSILMEGGVQYDTTRSTQAYAGLRIAFGGKENKAEGVAKRMTEYIRRDFNIVIGLN